MCHRLAWGPSCHSRATLLVRPNVSGFRAGSPTGDSSVPADEPTIPDSARPMPGAIRPGYKIVATASATASTRAVPEAVRRQEFGRSEPTCRLGPRAAVMVALGRQPGEQETDHRQQAGADDERDVDAETIGDD